MTRRFRSTVAGGVTAALAIFTAGSLVAQPVRPTNGPRPVDPAWHAIVGADVVTEPGSIIRGATIVFRDGTVTALGRNAAVPPGARVHDGDGLVITPGLIEPWLEVDVPAPDADSPGTHWNASTMAQRSALDGTGVDGAARKTLRSRGVVAAQIIPSDGILRGTASVVTLADPRDGHPDASVVVRATGHVVAIDGRVRGSYPGSKMGVIALVRQSLHDAGWLEAATRAHAARPAANLRPAPDDAMAALGRDLPLMIQAGDEHDVLRAIRIAAEFDRPAVVVGAGTEFRRLDAIAAATADVPLIVPITLPEAPGVKTVSDQRRASLRALQTWEQAPTNVARLTGAGVTVALTGERLRRGEKFQKNLRSLLDHGLDPDVALAAMTTVPADLLGIGERYGRLGVGTSASFVVSDGPLLERGTDIRDVWIDGVRHEVEPAPPADATGTWSITSTMMPGLRLELEVGDGPSLAFTPPGADGDDEDGPKPVKARSVNRLENRFNAVVDGSLFEADGPVPITAILDGDRLDGDALLPGGRLVTWAAVRGDEDDKPGADELEPGGDDAAADDSDDDTPITVPELPGLPFGAFGLTEEPEAETVLITGGTVWTSGPDGVIENGAVLMRGGVLRWVGPAGDLPSGLVTRDVRTIDASGRHVTPGLIDCHSHTGIAGGVNEGTQATTSEVRIADVIDPDDISWYRQLAGGVTAVNQLHGSANPIGGQNSVVKIRWGAPDAEAMRLAGAKPGIKWALGENVKQSRSSNATRYPRTRMGVEAIMRDRLEAGRRYRTQWDAWNALSGRQRIGRTPPRVDLELEALAEIVAGERLIHCHSYRQDEILMLCRLAEEFGFTIGTFQHVLEGYKVADAIAEHAIGGSCFSDWWAYKVEVYDAIGQNGSIMHDAGVVVSFNSDSDELARRLAAEAAKAVRYGGVPMDDALKFVTLNPAIQLAVDDRIGSLEVGKDADVVIWSGHPLSSVSRCEHTFVDGREYFSLERDAALRATASAERDRIMRRVIDGRTPKDDDDGRGGGKGADDDGHRLAMAGHDDHDDHDDHDHDAEELDQIRRTWAFMIRNGLDPQGALPGDCGCSIRDLMREGR